MNDYACELNGKTKTCEATNPLSAFKKAFSAGSGWHWELGDDGSTDMGIVRENGEVVAFCCRCDNG